MSFANKLKKFEKTFKTAKKRAHEEGFGNDLPDGKYKARLESCTLAEAQSSGRLQVDFAFVIMAGELKGEKVHKYACVETEDDQVWFARDLKRFGIEAPETADELEEVVKLLDDAKPELTISIKTKDSGQFTYIDKVHSDIEAGDLSEENGADEEAEDEEGDDEEDAEPEEDDDSEEEKDDDTAVEIGMEVVFKSESGKDRKGKVIKILEKEESVKVKTEKGNTYTVKLEDISIPEAEEDGEEQEEQEEVKVKKSKPSSVKKYKK